MILRAVPDVPGKTESLVQEARRERGSIVVCDFERKKEVLQEMSRQRREERNFFRSPRVFTLKEMMEANAQGKFGEREILLADSLQDILDCFLGVYGIHVEMLPEMPAPAGARP